MTEHEANRAIAEALQALTRAVEHAQRVGYGSMVLAPLAEAQKAMRYALDTAEGRV